MNNSLQQIVNKIITLGKTILDPIFKVKLMLLAIIIPENIQSVLMILHLVMIWSIDDQNNQYFKNNVEIYTE